MNKEFLKMQKIAGLITENQVKEIIGDIDDTPSPDGDFNPKDYALSVLIMVLMLMMIVLGLMMNKT